MAIDGKSLRGIHGDELPGVHLVALFAHGARRWLKRGVGDKEAELTVAPELLGSVDLAGVVVTSDTLYAQMELARQIVGAGGE